MATNDDDANKSVEGSSEGGEKICFDLFAMLLLACGDEETRAKRGQDEQERNMLMIDTITNAATNTFLLGKRKIDDESKNQQHIASSSSSSSPSLVDSKRRRVVESNDGPIRAEPIREIKPPVKKRKRRVKRKAPVRKEPVRREPVVTPGWVVDLMKRFKGREGDAKMIFEKAMTKTDLAPNQGRLLMPFNQMADMHFLTEAEWKILEEHHKHKGDVKKGVNVDEKMKGVDVILLRRNGNNKGWELNLRIWEMSSNFNYALCTGWNQVVRDNKLKTNQTITLWSFHSRDGTLYFAFDLPTQDEDGMALALVPVNSEASSSSMVPSEISEEDPFACEEANRRLYQFIRSSRTPRVCVQIITNDSSNLYLEDGLDLNRTPPEECTEMNSDLQAVQETTSQESLTEPSLVSWRFLVETAVLYVT